MARRLTPDDRRLWDRVARTVTPARPRKSALNASAASGPEEAAAGQPLKAPPRFVKPPKTVSAPTPPAAARSARPGVAPAASPDVLEPNRRKRLSRERDPIEATLDLHGFGRFEAQDQVTAFLVSAQARGLRAVLLITGQGRRGGGVIRASIREWLQAPALRGVVSGFAAAHPRHGGDGAIYVTLKRRG